MSIINMMRNIILCENVLGIYRNINNFSGTQRKIAFIRVFLELTVITVYYVHRLNEFMYSNVGITDDKIQSYSYIVLMMLNTTYVIIAAICNRHHYDEMFNVIHYTNQYMKKEQGYKKMMQCIYTVIASYIFTWAMIILLGSIPFLVILEDDLTLPRKIVYFIIGITTEGRLLLEDVVHSSVLLILSGSLECISTSVRNMDLKIIDILKQETIDLDGNKCVMDTKYTSLLLRHKIRRWRKNYEIANSGSVLAKQILGVQMYINISFAVIYLTVMIYRTITWYITHLEDFNLNAWSVILLFVHTIKIVVIAMAGQRIKSQSMTLHCRLARLNLTLLNLPDMPPDVMKMLSQLLRTVCTEPVAMDVVFSLHIGMPLLPQFLCFATEWVVVGLQGNHVI